MKNCSQMAKGQKSKSQSRSSDRPPPGRRIKEVTLNVAVEKRRKDEGDKLQDQAEKKKGWEKHRVVVYGGM